LTPLEAFGGIPSNQPKVLQPPGNDGRFGGSPALDEPPQRAAVIVEIITHAIQPVSLRRSHQPLSRKGAFAGAIARQRLQGVVALARRSELECRVRPTHLITYVGQWFALLNQETGKRVAEHVHDAPAAP
jgi:hypothetical protein